MWKAIQVEFIKTYSKPRTYIGIIAVVLIIGLIQIGFYSNREDFGDRVGWRMGDSISIENMSLNGNYICYVVLQMLFIHLPIIIALVSGDSISGEMSSGTIRGLMTKPLSRAKIFFAKLFVNQMYVLTIILTIMLFGLGLSLWVFGTGDMVVTGSEISVLPKSELLSRFLIAISLSYLTLTLVSSLSFMLSSLFENSIAPIVITMVVIIVFTILGSLDFELFEPMQHFLFTKHMAVWGHSFDFVPDFQAVKESIVILIGYILCFLIMAFTVFTRKDITQ